MFRASSARSEREDFRNRLPDECVWLAHFVDRVLDSEACPDEGVCQICRDDSDVVQRCVICGIALHNRCCSLVPSVSCHDEISYLLEHDLDSSKLVDMIRRVRLELDSESGESGESAAFTFLNFALGGCPDDTRIPTTLACIFCVSLLRKLHI
jgi:hypothetical protein